jgi:hypothetical protein
VPSNKRGNPKSQTFKSQTNLRDQYSSGREVTGTHRTAFAPPSREGERSIAIAEQRSSLVPEQCSCRSELARDHRSESPASRLLQTITDTCVGVRMHQREAPRSDRPLTSKRSDAAIRFEAARCGLARFGAVCIGFARFEAVWLGFPVWRGSPRLAAVWSGSMRLEAVWSGLQRLGAARSGLQRGHRILNTVSSIISFSGYCT